MALVPLTYAIDERLPFVFGIAQFATLFTISYFLSDVNHNKEYDVQPPINITWLKNNKSFIWFAVIFGLFAAMYTSLTDFKSIAFEVYGIVPATLGFYFSITSLAGAILGYSVHYLKKLTLKQYATIDILVVFIGLAGYSFGSPVIAVIAMVINFSFWRYRAIIYQEHIFKKYKTRYKATLMSVLFNAEQVNGVWLPVVFGVIVAALGLQTSFAIAAGFALIVAMPFMLFTVSSLEHKKPSA
ncbi:MAG: hypothetical protein ACI9T8_000674 [Candidatus Saccharimonadales bacterium]